MSRSAAPDQLALPGFEPDDEPGPTPAIRWGARDLAALLGLHAPTDEQVAVIEAPTAPLLVVAGAGSGKTETMAARVVWLVANGLVAPERVLGLTFTRKAAGELSERVRMRLRQLRARTGAGTDEAGDPVVGTYNAYAAELVADHGLRLGVEPRSRLLGEAAAWQLAHDVVEGWDVSLLAAGRAPETVVQAVLSLSGQLSEHLRTPADLDAESASLAAHVAGLPADARLGGAPGVPSKEVAGLVDRAGVRRELVPVVRAYVERKRSLEVLDFGDQVALAAQLATGFPEVAEAERSRWGVVLLDEYQDTSHAQIALLSALFADGHPVTAVGDPHQSIYGWRGASAGNLQAFPLAFPTPGGATRVATLATSWRNDAVVLEVANVVSGPLRDDGGRAHVAVPELAARPQAGAGEVVVRWSETAAEEAEALAADLARRWHAGGAVTAAVLCRKRSQFALVEEALRAAGLPVEVVGLGGLLDRPEVGDVVAALQAVHDPSRGDALLRLMTGPRWRIGPRDLRALAARARDLAPGRRDPDDAGVADDVDSGSVVEALDALLADEDPTAPVRGESVSPDAVHRLRRLARELAGLRRRTGVPLAELVADVERTLLLDVELAAHAVDPRGARAQLDAFGDVAAGFAEGASAPTLGGFLAWLAAASARERGLSLADEPDQEAGPEGPADVEASRTAVQLLTVHAAKGLEWDVVAVPGLVEQTFPAASTTSRDDVSSGWMSEIGALPYELRGDRESLPDLGWRAAADQAELTRRHAEFRAACGAHEVAEERRLAYVAVTRPRATLLLSGHSWAHQQSPRRPSRFLREVVDVLGADPRVTLVGATSEDLDAALALDTARAKNPHLGEPPRTPWPPDPLGGRRDPVRRAASAVLSAVADAAALVDEEPARTRWSTEVDRLLEERRAARTPDPDVVLPVHLSASRAVELARDPAALAARLRRPMPSEPRPQTRRGTAFHAWMEQRLGSAALVDLDDLPGAGDADAAADEQLPALQAAFEASEWATRPVVAVEVDVETPVAGVVLRGRIDAVFRAAGSAGDAGGVDVVDWKTGRPPRGADLRAAAVQLAVYRLAWSRLRGVPLDLVGAAFFYASTGQTLRPADGLAEADLVALVESVVVQPPA